MRNSFKYIYEDLLDNSKQKGPMAFIFKTKIHVMIVFAVFSIPVIRKYNIEED